MFADEFLRKEKTQDNAEAVYEVLSILTAGSSTLKLSPEKVAVLEVLKKRCNYQNKPLLEIYRERMMKAWREYPEPEFDMKRALSRHENAKILANKAAAKEGREKTEAEAKLSAETLFLSTRTFDETIFTQEGAKYRIDYKTGDADDNPIKFSEKIEWSTFRDEVHINPFSQTVDLYRSLMNIMKEGKRVGCDREQLCKIYKLFIFHHFKESHNALSYEEDPTVIWEILIGILDFSSHLTKLRESMRLIKRKPNEGIQKAVRAYASLIISQQKSPLCRGELCLPEGPLPRLVCRVSAQGLRPGDPRP